MNKKVIVIILLFILGSAIGVGSFTYYSQKQEQEKLQLILAKNNLEAKQYELAFNKFKNLAESNNAEAQYMLGKMYLNGSSPEQDKNGELGIYWIEKAARQGYSDAELQLGIKLHGDYLMSQIQAILKNGEKNQGENKAIPWLQKAVQKGNGEALGLLADIYLSGDGTKKDVIKAVDYYKKAIEKGNTKAYVSLAEIYTEGADGIAKDLNKATEYYQLAAINGDDKALYILAKAAYEEQNYDKALKLLENTENADGQFLLGEMYRQGLGVEKNQYLAAEWYEKAAEQRKEDAYFYVGYAYQNGYLGKRYEYINSKIVNYYNYNKAIEWYEKAAKNGSVAAQNNLANIYNGDGENNYNKNITKALNWYQKAADQGLDKAQYRLGLLYRNGEGTKRDYQKAMKLFNQSAEQGYVWSMVEIGLLYEEGNGITKDEKKAVEWYQKAADAGNAIGQVNLGFMYEKGKGVKQDLDKAINWYRKAANQGNERAMENIANLYSKADSKVYDEEKAIYWFEKLAEKGKSHYQFEMGLRYENGNGVEQNYGKAIEWYFKAADQKHGGALNNLGVLKNKGYPVNSKAIGGYTFSFLSARDYFRAACEHNDQIGCENYKNYRGF